MKILIIGLDGATWQVFDKYLLDTHMPFFSKLIKSGSSGVLRSTEPPITPAAWTTCITGCEPYTHNVLGFKDYNYQTEEQNNVEALNKKYQHGFRVDIDYLVTNKPLDTHCDEQYFKLKKQ